MSPDEIRKLIGEELKERLSITLDKDRQYGDGASLYVRVTLRLDGKEISSDRCFVSSFD